MTSSRFSETPVMKRWKVVKEDPQLWPLAPTYKHPGKSVHACMLAHAHAWVRTHIQTQTHTNNTLTLSNSKGKTICNSQKNCKSSMNTQNYIPPIAKEIQTTQVREVKFQAKQRYIVWSCLKRERRKRQMSNYVKLLRASGKSEIIIYITLFL